MKRRKWSSDQKLKIVLEGLSGQIEISKCSTNIIALKERGVFNLKKKDF